MSQCSTYHPTDIMMRSINLDSSKTYEERMSAIQIYFNTIYSLEKLQGEEIDLKEIVDANWEVHRPTIERIDEETMEE